MGVVIAATMVSGKPAIVNIRNSIAKLGFLEHKPSFGTARVVSVDSIAHPWPADVVYVGHGSFIHSRLASPWGNPYCQQDELVCRADGFYAYLWDRADLAWLLGPLVGKTLACHCKEGKCHAHILADAICALFPQPCTPSPPTRISTPLVCDTGKFSSSRIIHYGGTLSVDITDVGLNDIVLSSMGKRLAWCNEWVVWVRCIRAEEKGVFLEIFGGSGPLTKAFSMEGWSCAPPVDAASVESFNVLNPLFLSIIVSLVLEGRFMVVGMTPPFNCISPCTALLQSISVIAKACSRVGCHSFVTIPGEAPEWREKELLSLVSSTLCFSATIDVACFGLPYGITWRIQSSYSGTPSISLTSRNNALHAPSRKVIFPPLLADRIAQCFSSFVGCAPAGQTQHLAGLVGCSEASSMTQMLDEISFVPSAKRARGTVGTRVAACIQPCKRVAPMLLPEGLGPVTHLETALALQHPFARPPSLGGHLEDAVREQPECPQDLIQARENVCELIRVLADAVHDEYVLWIEFVHPRIREIVRKRLVPFCREVSYITNWPDPTLWSGYVQGLPMFGWAEPSLHLPPKLTVPQCGGELSLTPLSEHNAKILAASGSTGDVNLDVASWEKTKKELAAMTLVEECSAKDLPEGVRLLPRRPIWECHGSQEVSSCRNIDDALVGEQNDTVGLYSVHRPWTVDNLAEAGRRVAERFPDSELGGFTSDFGGAYRQVPASPTQAESFGIVTWDPERLRIVVFLAVAQLFGSRSAPLNFSRFPDWCSFCCAALFCISMGQCVDDLISIERWSTVSSARTAWLLFAKLCGWDIPLAKSPEPSQRFRALGVCVVLTDLPRGPGFLVPCGARVDSIISLIMGILEENKVGSGKAASLCGKLVFAGSALAGRFGKAMMRALRRRCYERRANINCQLRYCLHWWMSALKSAPPRPIPWNLESMPVVVTYSDGEGSDAGVGVAIWSNRLPCAQAGRIDVPLDIRALWAQQRLLAKGDPHDIQEVEGIGPLLLLSIWPSVLRDSL